MEDALNIAVSTPPIPLTSLTTFSCRYPIGDPFEEGFGFCGAPQDPGHPYCTKHCQLAYLPTPIEPKPNFGGKIASRWTDKRDRHPHLTDRAITQARIIRRAESAIELAGPPTTKAEREARYRDAALALKRQRTAQRRAKAYLLAEKHAERMAELNKLPVVIYPPYMTGPSIRRIIAEVCAVFPVYKIDILSKRRTNNIARPRQVVMYLARYLTPLSFPEIGRRLGGKDHSTIFHGVDKIERLIEQDPEFRAKIALLLDKLTPDEA